MSRLAPLDKALVLILVPLWVVWFAVAVHSQVRGGGFPMVVVSLEGAEHYPEITGEVSQNYPPDWLAHAGLGAGDRLLRVGDADLRGVGMLGFWARSIDESEGRLLVPLVFEKQGELRETSLALIPVTIWRPLLIASLALAASAL
ncbi:MAG: hypothetical protein JRG83_15730, partial [Deltaproteobacteria bacterium]|nr:hypothetical protein [Deltaproteobacteria bacterium]